MDIGRDRISPLIINRLCQNCGSRPSLVSKIIFLIELSQPALGIYRVGGGVQRGLTSSVYWGLTVPQKCKNLAPKLCTTTDTDVTIVTTGAIRGHLMHITITPSSLVLPPMRTTSEKYPGHFK